MDGCGVVERCERATVADLAEKPNCSRVGEGETKGANRFSLVRIGEADTLHDRHGAADTFSHFVLFK